MHKNNKVARCEDHTFIMLEGVIHLNLQSTPMQSCSVFVVGIIQQHSPHIQLSSGRNTYIIG